MNVILRILRYEGYLATFKNTDLRSISLISKDCHPEIRPTLDLCKWRQKYLLICRMSFKRWNGINRYYLCTINGKRYPEFFGTKISYPYPFASKYYETHFIRSKSLSDYFAKAFANREAAKEWIKEKKWLRVICLSEHVKPIVLLVI